MNTRVNTIPEAVPPERDMPRLRCAQIWRAGCLAALCVLIFSCQDKTKPPVARDIDPNAIPTQESWNSTVVFSDSGVVRARLRAGHILIYESRRETILEEGITIDFYNRDGSHSSVLTASRGRVDDATRNMEAFDNVRAVSDSGTVVTTEYLFWNNATKKIRSDRFVKVVSPKEILQGYGFESDQDLKNYVIFRVSGSAAVQEGRGEERDSAGR